MRRPCQLNRPVRLFTVVAALATLLGACSRSEPMAPDSRLGATSHSRPGYGRNGSDGAFGKGSGAPGSVQQFQTSGSDIVYFSSDSVELSPESQTTLTQQARWLNQYQGHSITIEGHADERGTREYNIALGARRAAAVKSFLASQNVIAARMRTISYGKERPVATCNDISCWSQNRRAQTVLSGQAISRN